MPHEYVRVEGLTELRLALNRVDKGLRKELNSELRSLAKLVAKEAQVVARERGLIGDPRTDTLSGSLVKRIGVSVRGSTAWIVDKATRTSTKYPSGFPYPAVYEFGGGGTRSFLRPSIAANTDHIVAGIEEMLVRLERNTGLQ